MENANIDLLELEEEQIPLKKQHSAVRYPFPAVTLGSYTTRTQAQITFNRHCAPYLGDVKALTISSTPNYFIFMPTDAASRAAVSCRHNAANGQIQMGMPASLKELKPKVGARKLLRYKSGFAISRYDILD